MVHILKQAWKDRKITTKPIELEDGTLVEVEVPTNQAQQISGGFADKVEATFGKIQPF